MYSSTGSGVRLIEARGMKRRNGTFGIFGFFATIHLWWRLEEIEVEVEVEKW